MDCHDRGETRMVWRVREDGLEESVQFIPGFACIKKDNSLSHGKHGMEVNWVLRGQAGAINFRMKTDWIPSDEEQSKDDPFGLTAPSFPSGIFPMGSDIGIHSVVPLHKVDDPYSHECALIGGTCYYEISFSRASNLTSMFLVWGEQVIWDELLETYQVLRRR